MQVKNSIFPIFSFIFIAFLLFVVIYEVVILDRLPVNDSISSKKDKTVIKEINDNYNIKQKFVNAFLPNASGEYYSRVMPLGDNNDSIIMYSDSPIPNPKPYVLDENEEFKDEDEKHKKGFYEDKKKDKKKDNKKND